MSLKNILLDSAVSIAVASTALAKETLYIVNTGSKGGSYNGQLTALSAGLSSKYNIEYVQAKGCKKSSSVIKKLVDKSMNVISLYASSAMGKNLDCEIIFPNKNNFMFANTKAGIIFSHKDVTESFLTAGVTVGIMGTLDKVADSIAKANGVSFKLVRYKNAKAVTLGVLNKEVQFGITNSAKRFWKNTKKLKGHYVQFNSTIDGIPSIKTIGVDPISTYDNYIYYGANREKLLSEIRDIFKDSNSDYAKGYDGQKGMANNILSDEETRWSQVLKLGLPQ